MRFDFVIIGGGSAGCVLARRLSDDARFSVLVLEAGADTVPEPRSIRLPFPTSVGEPSYWRPVPARLKAPRGGASAGQRVYPQASILGGAGSLMGMVALRGAPADYDEWREAGAAGWGWDNVLPYFRKLESDADCAGPLHGRSGPIPIRRRPRSEWSRFADGMAAAFNEDGYPPLDDLNGAFRDGHGPMPFSNTAERRMSSAAAYLSENGRARTNLTVLCGSEAARIIFADDRRATAVEFRGVAGLRRVEAGQVILSAGAVHSPELLMRSGVGPGAALAQAGIECVRDLPGVGANLQNHPILYLSFLTARQDRQRDAPLNYNALRYSSGLPGCPPSDMFMPVMSRPTWNALGRSINALGVAVYKSLSKGAVRLEPNGALHVDLDLFSDERDLARMVDGLRRCFRYLNRLPKGMCRHLFVPTRQSLIQQLLRPTPLNAARATLIAGLMDAAPFLSGPITQAVGVDPVGLIDDDEALTRFVHEHSSPMYHLVGTCRMGAHDDPMAVVDERCAVRGVTGLRVGDGSVIPTIVRANTNIPIIMVAEKAADMIVADARGG